MSAWNRSPTASATRGPDGTLTPPYPILMRWRPNSPRAMSPFRNLFKIPTTVFVASNSKTLTAMFYFSAVLVNTALLNIDGLDARLKWTNPGFLPDQWRQMELHPLTVIRVTGQTVAKELLFIENSKGEDENHRNNHQDSPPRSERDGRTEEYDKRPRIHRMANDCVWSCRDHPLTGVYLNCR